MLSQTISPLITSIFSLCLFSIRLFAEAHEKPDPTRLTLDRIFTAEEFKEEKAPTIRWSQKSADYFTLATPQIGKLGKDLVRHQAESGKKTVLATAQQLTPMGAKKPLTIESYEFNADETQVLLFTNTRKVWRKNTRGDYWLLDLATKKLTQLGGDAAASTLMFAKFSPDSSRLAYVCKNNLHVQNLTDMKITALTTDGSDTLINATSDWVNEEELSIRDGFRWSSDGTQIVFWQFDTKDVKKFWLVNQTESNYQRLTSFPYPKAGEKNSATRLGIVKITSGAVTWLHIPGDPREHYLPHVEWTPDGRSLLIQQLNRLQNTNRVMRADPGTGETEIVLTETDKAWLENKNDFTWIGESGDFLWLSERSGWRHAYRAQMDGKLTPITQGDFDVIDIAHVDAKDGWLYYIASPENATQRYLYRVKLDGTGSKRLSPSAQSGTHSYDICTEGHWAVHTHSSFTTPPVVEIVSLPEHRSARVLVDQSKLKEKLSKLKQPQSEFLRLDIGGGVQLDAWCLKQADLDLTQKHPLLIHVYGEPAGQTVRDAWGGSKHLWHWMLAQQGYIVASVDNRGTPSPRGRDWRRSVYRQVGILASKEQQSAVEALLKRLSFLDATRVGIWGWSGGGSMSLNALFRYPEHYRMAMAVAPVADMQLYDTIYQERYMGLPKDNAEGYKLGSPITYAKQLKGDLLIVHGTGDDNVHYQATEKLINELILQNKRFTVMPYPNRDHAIDKGKGTTRHLYGLLTNYLHAHLPTQPK
jgi:dipeptidyl-peptidase 4